MNSFNNKNIHKAVKLWRNYKISAIIKYGYICDWDVRGVTNMGYLFMHYSYFNEDISKCFKCNKYGRYVFGCIEI